MLCERHLLISRRLGWVVAALVGVMLGATGAKADEANAGLTAAPFTAVQLNDSFWAPRIAINRESVLPHCLQYCQETGRIDNFAKAGNLMSGEFRGTFFDDSDVYKVIEGAAYCLSQQRDPVLEGQVDSVIAKIASAQRADGYLYCYYTIRRELRLRWSNEAAMHESYCAGHLIEAAVAYYRATGKRQLLNVACRVADHMCTVFGPTLKHDVPGHQEAELALFKLYALTGQRRYLKLAQFWLEQRGKTGEVGHKLYGDYCQDDRPIREQTGVQGHAVRAMYYYSGIADLAKRTGDPGLTAAMNRIWHDVVDRKMYLTGGIGPSASNEGFTVAYDLPNESAYCETCASIGMALWNQRLALMSGDAKYVDVLERVAYNGLISGVSLKGDTFFYVNPLASAGKHHRQAWFGCACCPTNVVRFLPSISGYQYAVGADSIYANLYISGQAKLDVNGKTVVLTQTTNYPWDGHIELTVGTSGTFALRLRIPGWARGEAVPGDLYAFDNRKPGEIVLKVNGYKKSPATTKGYATLNRTWKAGDKVTLDLPMPVQRVRANASVKADTGKVALQRGPIVYCIEGVDCPQVAEGALTEDATVATSVWGDQLGGVTVLQGELKTAAGSVPFTAIPYYAWDNREAGPMAVWLPTDQK